MPKMLDIADQLIEKWARLNPGEAVDVPGRHDPADAGHDRPLRVRVPVQLLLPGHAAPVRRGDDADPHGVAGPGAPAQGPDAAEDPRAAAAGRGPGVHERPGGPAHRRAARPGRCGRHHGSAGPDAHRRRQADRRAAAGLQHPGAVHHLPHRRPRDDVGPAVVRDLLPDEEPRRSRAGAGRGEAGARQRGIADVRAGHAAALRAADPRRDAPAVADRPRASPATPTKTP